MTEVKAVDISKLDRPALEARYREMRSWLIACLRGNNHSIDEDALLHTIWPEESADYEAGIRTGDAGLDIGAPCTIANDVVGWLDQVKAGTLTPAQCVDSLEFAAEAGGWRGTDGEVER